MGSLSIWHWLIVLAMFSIVPAAVVVPIAKILTKAGYSGWWVICFLIPGLGFVAMWVFAFSRWPALAAQPPQRVMQASAQLREAADSIDKLNSL